MTHTPPRRRNLRRLAIIWSAGGFALTAALAGGMTCTHKASVRTIPTPRWTSMRNGLNWMTGKTA